MQVSGAITAGDLFASMAEEETFRFYEADGVTPVNMLTSTTPETSSFLLLLSAIPFGLLVARWRRSITAQS
jgi:hypothetical protein